MLALTTWFNGWKQVARKLTRSITSLYYACLDARTPWYARLLALLVVAYALSPLDLIPDPIPVLGYLDDLLLLPIGIWLALKLVPPEVMVAAQARADVQGRVRSPLRWLGAAVILAVYFLIAIWFWRLLGAKPE